ncbi:MAG TPA: hypothetical protein VM939_14505 [Gemmatimonadaceae bacterium]|nr:hypothetical protein [Gemmatimonadaceae bacterium]
MKHTSILVTLSAGALGLAACAPKTPAEGGAEPVRTSASAPAAGWTANIQSVTQSRSDIGQSARARSYGTATVSRAVSNNLTRVSVIFNHSGSDRFLNWGIYPGTCGSPSLPVIPTNNFPELQIGGGGRAQTTADIPFEFPTTGNYHINIYRERQQNLEGLLACGNLRPTAG